MVSHATSSAGTEKVGEKSNEITAIPSLLEMPMIRGCVVSIDAMGCQTEITNTIIEQGADYVLALKGNQGNLHNDVRELFTSASDQNFKNVEHQFYETISMRPLNKDMDARKLGATGQWVIPNI